MGRGTGTETRRAAKALGRWLERLVAGRRVPEAAPAPSGGTGSTPSNGGPGTGRRGLPSPLHLAYLGDAVWELHVRTHLVADGPERLADIHRRAVDQVRAAAQAGRLREIEAQLTADEREMVRRGRNASPHGPRSAGAAEYRHSTGFECLLGYLYWTGQVERLQELLGRMSREAAAEAPEGHE